MTKLSAAETIYWNKRRYAIEKATLNMARGQDEWLVRLEAAKLYEVTK